MTSQVHTPNVGQEKVTQIFKSTLYRLNTFIFSIDHDLSHGYTLNLLSNMDSS
jgi:hypothetical protein